MICLHNISYFDIFRYIPNMSIVEKLYNVNQKVRYITYAIRSAKLLEMSS